jgi:hypothetical protein
MVIAGVNGDGLLPSVTFCLLPKTLLRHNITNPSTNETLKIYKAARDYPRFYNNFLRNSDNGRSSLRIQVLLFAWCDRLVRLLPVS